MKARDERYLPTIERLKQLIDYDPANGVMTWRPRSEADFSSKNPHYTGARLAHRWNSQFAGKSCGCDNGAGYLVTRIGGMSIKAHRIAFAIYHGRWPGEMVDHINGIKSDNRIENLREVTRSQNLQNQRVRKGTSAYKGVTWDKGMSAWLVQIRLNKVNNRVGFYDDEVVAARAYDAAAIQLFGEYARLNFPSDGKVSAIQ